MQHDRPKITFVGAGSAVFARNILGDAMLQDSLHEVEIALYDIDAERLHDAELIIKALNRQINQDRARITAHCGVSQRRAALREADFVVNAIQVGGYEPATVADFEIPKRYGLRQTIGDTLGIGGIFRALRTIPVMLDLAADMQAECPQAWLLNYTNPMAAVTGAVLQASAVQAVGLCHSVQVCAKDLLRILRLDAIYPIADCRWRISGINHQAWLTEISHRGIDLYPHLKEVARQRIGQLRARGTPGALMRDLAERLGVPPDAACHYIYHFAKEALQRGELSDHEYADISLAQDLVRLEMMLHFGYYLTESSEHSAEYLPYFIKSHQPSLIDHYHIPLDEYPRRCRRLIRRSAEQRATLLDEATNLGHTCSIEYGAHIMHAVLSDSPYRIHGNILNHGLINNLPRAACVEVPCLVDANGVQGCAVADLPPQCAALNRTNINTTLLTVEAALTLKKDHLYQAAMLDPHTAAELSLDQIVALCDELLAAHAQWLPEYR